MNEVEMNIMYNIFDIDPLKDYTQILTEYNQMKVHSIRNLLNLKSYRNN